MIIVADTSPLCYLILIEEINLLPQLFGKIYIPQAVAQELKHEDAPIQVKKAIATIKKIVLWWVTTDFYFLVIT